MSHIELIAATQMGLEAITAQELRALGYSDLQVDNGRVTFRGQLADICRTNMWLRTADRILVKMGEFPATTFDELFEGVKALEWADWIPADAEFPVNGKSHKSQLSSVPACQGIVKKAVVEKLKLAYGIAWFDEKGPRFTIEVALLKDIATITLDTTGPSLHKRGYRKLVTQAPLKETTAAALVMLSRWTVDRPLYDPFCGSGTIPIEAALIGWNIAPGIRRHYDADQWPLIPADAWSNAREEAFDLVKDEAPLEIMGSDIDPDAIDIAKANAKKAGFGRDLRFHTLSLQQIHPNGDYGCLITNPPYGERIGDSRESQQLMRWLGRVHKQLVNWSTFVLTSDKELEHEFHLKADKKRKLYNGRIECHYYQFHAKGYYSNKKQAASPPATPQR